MWAYTARPTSSSTPSVVEQSATVVRVVDGDTIRVVIDGQEYAVRYIGIDAPETNEQVGSSRQMAALATEANRRLVEGQVVRLERDVSETDRYGRLLRYVWVGETMVNAELVRLGVAVAKSYPPDTKHQQRLQEAQTAARTLQQGVWAQATAAPPPTASREYAAQLTPPTTQAGPPQPTTAPIAPAAPTALPALTLPPASTSTSVRIRSIFFDGRVSRVESDEYCEIVNEGATSVRLQGWRLNADDPGQDYWFPDIALEPGQSVRVYTNEIHPEYGGLSFGSAKALWNNSDKECGRLYDPSGHEVSTFCY